jgi:hypothetical protein
LGPLVARICRAGGVYRRNTQLLDGRDPKADGSVVGHRLTKLSNRDSDLPHVLLRVERARIAYRFRVLPRKKQLEAIS